jgi:hypothetical protein
MAYEAKAGSFSLFKNDRKEKDTHPDYKGDGKDLDGNDVWVSAWIKDGAKGKFMSCSIQRKDASQQSKPTQQAAQAPSFDDTDIPF